MSATAPQFPVPSSPFDVSFFAKYEPRISKYDAAAFAARATAKAQRAIGKRYKVYRDKKTYVEGVISAVDFAYLRFTRRSAIAVYRVALSDGPHTHIVNVDTLPR